MLNKPVKLFTMGCMGYESLPGLRKQHQVYRRQILQWLLNSLISESQFVRGREDIQVHFLQNITISIFCVPPQGFLTGLSLRLRQMDLWSDLIQPFLFQGLWQSHSTQQCCKKGLEKFQNKRPRNARWNYDYWLNNQSFILFFVMFAPACQPQGEVGVPVHPGLATT